MYVWITITHLFNISVNPNSSSSLPAHSRLDAFSLVDHRNANRIALSSSIDMHITLTYVPNRANHRTPDDMLHRPKG